MGFSGGLVEINALLKLVLSCSAAVGFSCWAVESVLAMMAVTGMAIGREQNLSHIDKTSSYFVRVRLLRL